MFGAPDEPVKISRWRPFLKVIVVIAVLVVVSLLVFFAMQ